MESNSNKGTPDNEPESGAPVEAIPLRWVRVSHHTPDHIAARYPYAAYGSNLSLEQMSRRCQTADIKGAGVLRDAKAIFAYYMGIVEAAGSTVPMAVYTMTAADVAAMDRHEGLGRSYERYLVTVEMNGEAVRCFTYIKRDNALEEPSERYYQRCLQGYNDWDFDTRRLRHAKEDAKKNGKRRTYSKGYGFWDGTQAAFDWDSYRKGTASKSSATTTRTTSNGERWYQDSNGAWRRVKDGDKRGAFIPTVRSYDQAVGNDEPIASGTAASYQPKVSLVTGRELPSSRKVRQAVSNWKAKHGSAATVDPARISTLNGDNVEIFTGRDGQQWRKGPNGVWFRVKE